MFIYLGTKEAYPSHLVFVPKKYGHYGYLKSKTLPGAHRHRQYAMWEGYLSPRLNSDIPEGIPDTYNAQIRRNWRWATFVFSILFSGI